MATDNLVSDYKAIVLTQTVVGELKRLKDLSQKFEFDDLSKTINAQLQRISSESFSVAIIGEFKRGKSTFINAFLGAEVLPADVIPTTATLNRIVYSSEARVELSFKDGLVTTISPSELESHVTKLSAEAENTAAQIAEAVIYYPIPHCQADSKFSIVDTPGLNDDAAMTAVTLQGLQSCEAAIMVIMADSPFSQSEEAILHDYLLNSHLGQLIFVVNGIDRLRNANDVERVLNLVETRIHSSVLKWIEKQSADKTEIYLRKYGKTKVFPISALQALKAKLENDEALLQSSGFASFEQELTRIFSQERFGIASQVAVNQTLSAANALLTRIEQQLPLLAENQVATHQLYESLSDEHQKLTEYLAEFDNIIRNMQEASYQQGDAFIKQTLKIQLENTIETSVNTFFETYKGKITASLEWNDEFCKQLNAAISAVPTDSVAFQAYIIEQQATSDVLREYHAVKEWGLSIFEDMTLHFAPQITSNDVDKLHRKTADILQKVTAFQEKISASSISPPFILPKPFSCTTETVSSIKHPLPDVQQHLSSRLMRIIREDFVGVLILEVLMLFVSLLASGGKVADMLAIFSVLSFIMLIGWISSIPDSLNKEALENLKNLEAYRQALIYGMDAQLSEYLDSHYTSQINAYISSYFENVNALQKDIQLDIAGLRTIIQSHCAACENNEETLIAKQQQLTAAKPEITTIRQQMQRLSDQLEPIIRGR